MKKLPLQALRLIPLLLMSLLLVLAACTPPLTRGYVYDKQYDPAYSQYIPGYTTESCFWSGKVETCSALYHPAIVIYHPAYYYLRLTTCSDLGTTDQEGCQTGWVGVDEGTYDNARIGSYYGG